MAGRLILLLGFCAVCASVPARDDVYAQELLQAARDRHLADRAEWRTLLHYRSDLFGPGATSLIDDPAFFLAAAGKTDPADELAATLAAFLGDSEAAVEPARCRFPARYAWLKQELGFDPEKLAEPRCERFENWLAMLQPRRISLIFASAYLNNPASMFGHTLLRIDAEDSADLLAHAASYAARTGGERGMAFALKGLFGGYPGRFSVLPYYLKVKEYGDIENRDLWEYRLDLTPDETMRLLRHLWELGAVYADYFFLDENCAYQLLLLLEAARPDLRLSDRFRGWAIPSDTIRAVTATPGLLKAVKFRPARSTVALSRWAAADGEMRSLADALAMGRTVPDAPALEALSTTRRAQALELAIDLAEYRKATDAETAEALSPIVFGLLKARNRLDLPAQTPHVPVPEVRPDQGHASSRFRFGNGLAPLGYFLQLEYRPAYHDLMDPKGGYIRGSQIQVFNTALRIFPERGRVELERFDALDVVSLAPWNRSLSGISWKAGAGAARRYLDGGRTASLVGRFNPGVGLSYDLAGHTLFYAFAEGSLEVAEEFRNIVALGIGPSFGVYHDFSKSWRAGLSGRWLNYWFGGPRHSDELLLQQRIGLSEENALHFELSLRREAGRDFLGGMASWQVYF
ncbi:Lnb N-terminal periplasmic domain-containing protein [Methylocaldum sp. MU1018]